IPCLLYILNDLRLAGFFLMRGHWPTREDVEPATKRNLDDDEYITRYSDETQLPKMGNPSEGY
ncbi:MAG: hypothetical protein JJU11_14610, partial [Candidatus Sumerlaeia bacterium]|nr:hypothetical protein [Candidatus Sumerlaeia bacterium]